jgi:hypothetical protein
VLLSRHIYRIDVQLEALNVFIQLSSTNPWFETIIRSHRDLATVLEVVLVLMLSEEHNMRTSRSFDVLAEPMVLLLRSSRLQAGASWPECSGKPRIRGRTLTFLQGHMCNWGIIIDDMETWTYHDYEFTTSHSEYL